MDYRILKGCIIYIKKLTPKFHINKVNKERCAEKHSFKFRCLNEKNYSNEICMRVHYSKVVKKYTQLIKNYAQILSTSLYFKICTEYFWLSTCHFWSK